VNNDSQQNSNGTTGDGLFDFVQGITVDAQNGELFLQKLNLLVVIFKMFWEVMTRNLSLMIYILSRNKLLLKII
jgi:hypothetical protein